MMITKNPYVAEEHSLLRKFEETQDPTIQVRLDEVQEKSAEYLEQCLDKLKLDVSVTADKIEELETKPINLRQKYREAIQLSRDLQGYTKDGEVLQIGLVQRVRNIKEDIRRKLGMVKK